VCGFSHVDFNGRERKEMTKDKMGSMSIQSSNSRLSRGILQMERDQMEYHQNGDWIQSLRSNCLGWRHMTKSVGINISFKPHQSLKMCTRGWRDRVSQNKELISILISVFRPRVFFCVYALVRALVRSCVCISSVYCFFL
jgi:hypothetical protein